MKLLLFLLTGMIAVCLNAENVRKILPLSEDEYKLIEKGSRSLLGPSGNMVYFPKNQAIMIEDTQANVEKISIYINSTRDLVKKDEKKPEAKEPVPEAKAEVSKNYKIIPLGTIEYGTVDEVCRPWLSENGRLMYSLSNNAVIVVDKPEVIAAVEKFVRDLIKAAPEAKYDNIRYNDTYYGDSAYFYSGDGYWGGWSYPYYYYPWRRPYRPWRPYPRPPRPRPPGPLPPRPHPPGPRPPGPLPRPDGGSEIRPGNDGPGRPDRPGGGGRPFPGHPGGGGGHGGGHGGGPGGGRGR